MWLTGVVLCGCAGGAAQLAFRRHPQRSRLVRSSVSLAHCVLWWWCGAEHAPLEASMVYFAGDMLHMLWSGDYWPTMMAHHGMALLLLRQAAAAAAPLRRTVAALFYMAEMSNLPGTLAYASLKLLGRPHPLTQKLLGVQLACYSYWRTFRISDLLLRQGAELTAQCPVALWPCWLIWPMGLWWTGKLWRDLWR